MVHVQRTLHELVLLVFSYPRTLVFNVSDNGLSSFMDMNVFDSDLLLALSTVLVEGVDELGDGAGQFVGLLEILLGCFEVLIGLHDPARQVR